MAQNIKKPKQNSSNTKRHSQQQAKRSKIVGRQTALSQRDF